jgi:hypothetical protein
MKWKSLTAEYSALQGDEACRTYLVDHLEETRENIRESSRQASWHLAMLFAVFLLSELLRNQAATEVDVGVIKISDMSLVSRVLPVVAAWSYYSMTGFILLTYLLRGLHDKVIQSRHPVLHGNAIKELLVPTSRLGIFNVLSEFASEITGWHGTVMAVFVGITFVVVLAAPLLMCSYMVFTLFMTFGLADWLTWSAAALTIVFLLQGAFNIVAMMGIEAPGTYSL